MDETLAFVVHLSVVKKSLFSLGEAFADKFFE
jgi:hypothetical protein